MHAMGPNVAGVIGSAVAAGILLSYLYKIENDLSFLIVSENKGYL